VLRTFAQREIQRLHRTSSVLRAPSGLLQRKCRGGGGFVFAPEVVSTVRNTSQRISKPPAKAPDELHRREAARVAGEAPSTAWDFTRIPVFPADRATEFRASSAPSAPPQPVIQRKLVVGEVDDSREHDANRVADQVMRGSTPDVSTASLPPHINHRFASCDEESETKTLQFKRAGAPETAAGEVPAIVHEVLRAPGQPLDAATRAFFEPRFGFSFGQVRVHTDEQAVHSARAIGAKAYTAGQAIVFGRGAFAPGDQAGQQLLAHELAHVVQQHPAAQNGATFGSSIVQRDAESDDYKQGYEDGLNGEATRALPRAGDALVDYDEGYSRGHYEFTQKTKSGGTSGPTSTQAPPPPPPPAAGGTTKASDSRSLTPTERAIAEFVFGPSLNLDPIVIKESSVMAVGGYVRTLPDTIYVAPGEKDTISPRLLVHELTHCAQYQHGVPRVVTAAYAIEADYDYGDEQGLIDAIKNRKCFDQFNTEQQADIVQDYYLRVVSGASTYPWRVFIDQVRAHGACIWPTLPRPVPDKPTPGRATG